jgi:Ca-activated chloride channel family protein
MEAECFSKELDKILSGRPVAADLDPELAKDLAFAAKLSALDYSKESRSKIPAKAKILAKAEENRLRGFLRRVGVRPLVLAAASLALILAPFFMSWLASDGGERTFLALFAPRPTMSADSSTQGIRSGNYYFGAGSSPYENGNNNIAAGGAIGGAGGGGSKSVGESLSYIEAKERQLENMRLGGAGMNLVRQNPGFRGAAGARGPGGLDGTKKAGANAGDAFSRTGSALSGLNAAATEQIPPGAQPLPADREGYAFVQENPFQKVSDHPLSTFSIDVDAASYSNARRFLNGGTMPPEDAVRLEEFINYFKYAYPEPQGEHPFSITTEVAACPWNEAHKLVRVGLKGKSIAKENLPPNNLVFLIDSSGSMMGADRLGLVQAGLRLLVEQLRKEDRISIVTYAGSAGLVLPPTSGARKADILAALDRLQAGGSTAGGAGIQLAYKVAAENFIKKGNNRVILATDGDFNVGVTSDGELTRLIEEKREHGVFLTVLGVGTGNYQDSKMEQLADKGNGNYAYLDDIMEAQKVLVKEMGGTLLTLAKDVKLQVEFNPARASSYKLIGYENRVLAAQDFNDDKKDAGELGAGHTVTALYEVVPAGVKDDALPAVDPLKYQAPAAPAPGASESKELLTVKFRYKKPNETTSRLISRPLADEDREWAQASPDFKFAASAAGFGMMLRHSKTKGDLTYDKVRAMAKEGQGKDEDGYRAEMVRLVEKAKLLDQKER